MVASGRGVSSGGGCAGLIGGSDPIERPAHYTFGRHEVLDVIEDWGLGYHLGNVVKYVARAGRKGDMVEDLKKARFYLDRLIRRLEGGER